MKLENARLLRSSWVNLPDEFFEALTFDDLPLGEKFIYLPEPGDNHGHGGFKGVHHIFIKTEMEVSEAGSGLSYGVPHGRAVDSRRVAHDIPHSMHVVPVR